MRIRPHCAVLSAGTGELLVSGGVIVALFMAYVFWGTGLRESGAQHRFSLRAGNKVFIDTAAGTFEYQVSTRPVWAWPGDTGVLIKRIPRSRGEGS